MPSMVCPGSTVSSKTIIFNAIIWGIEVVVVLQLYCPGWFVLSILSLE